MMSKVAFFLLSALAVVAQFPVNDTGVPLPAGCKQVLWFRGGGTQNYVCSDPTNTGKLSWTLVEPYAVLQQYSNSLLNMSVTGFHYFTKPGVDGQAGSGAGWSLGSGCDYYNCTSITDQFLGSVNASAAQPGTIPWLLISKVSSFGPSFGNIDYAQRLSTFSGVVPFGCQYLGQTFNAPYQADYLFSTCPVGSQPTSSPQNPHSKYQSAFLKKLHATSTPTSSLNPNHPHRHYTKEFYRKQHDSQTTSPTLTTLPTPTTSKFNPNNPHGQYQEEFLQNQHHAQDSPSTSSPETQHPTITPKSFDSSNPHGKYQEEFLRKQQPTATSLPSSNAELDSINPEMKEFMRKCHEPTPPPATPASPAPTDTPNVATYEKYTPFHGQVHHSTRGEPAQPSLTHKQLPHVPSHHQENKYFPINKEKNGKVNYIPEFSASQPSHPSVQPTVAQLFDKDGVPFFPRVDVPEINRPPSDFGVGIEYTVDQTNADQMIDSKPHIIKDYGAHLRRLETK